MNKTSHGREKESGFAALLTIGMIAILSVTIMAAFNMLGAERSAIRALDARARFTRASATVEARVAFILLTQPMGPRGPLIGADRTAVAAGAYADPVLASGGGRSRSPELSLDSRPYTLDMDGKQVIVRMQDSAGLVNLNGQSAAPIARLAMLLGKREDIANALSATLADYVDEDDQTRASGAESRDYAAAKMPVPADSLIIDERQIGGVLGWDNDPIFTRQIVEYTAPAAFNESFNVNTASLVSLRAALGIDERMAGTIIAQREHSPFRSVDDLISRTGAQIDPADGPIGATVAKEIKLSIALDGRDERRIHQTRLVLTLDDDKRPFMLGAPSSGRKNGKEDNYEHPQYFPWIHE